MATSTQAQSRARQQRIERRRRVAELRLAGVRDQNEIAALLGVTQSCVSRDCKALDAEWRFESRELIAEQKRLDLARIETLIGVLWTDATGTDDKKRNWAIDRVAALLERKAKMLGLDAPLQVDVRSELEAEARKLAAERGIDLDVVMAQVEEILQQRNG